MANLQKTSLGVAPDGAGGDDARTAFSKGNANVDVISTQVALTSGATVTNAQALTSVHTGKRVNIALSDDSVISMPVVSTCAADQVILLRNLGPAVATLAPTDRSGDTVALSRLNPGESVLMDSDGVHTWGVLMRGRVNGDNEVVTGTLSVAASLSVGSVVSGTSRVAAATISETGVYSGPGAGYSGNVTVGGTLGVTGAVTLAGALGVTGAATFSARPTFGGNTPWDTGNLPASVAGGVLTFTSRPKFGTATPWDSANFNPAAYATIGGASFTGAVYAPVVTTRGGAMNASTYNIGNGGVLIMYEASPGTGTIGFRTGGDGRYFSLDSGGNGNALNGSWINGSDASLKQNIATIKGALDKVNCLRGVYYEKKGDPEKRQVGVIAQEVQDVFPEAVHEINGDGLLGVAYGNLVGPLIEAIKELTVRVWALEGKHE